MFFYINPKLSRNVKGSKIVNLAKQPDIPYAFFIMMYAAPTQKTDALEQNPPTAIRRMANQAAACD